jgi:arsenate reductase (thioredoxin)
VTKVVFLCVGNMCRSQMAEGLARFLGGAELVVESAGTRPSGVVSREAIRVMGELGIDISDQWSKGFDEVDLAGADVVISMAPEPARALVPREFPGMAQDWDIPDPVGQPVESFRIIRQELAERVEALVEELGIEPAPLPAPGEIRYGEDRPLGRDR